MASLKRYIYLFLPFYWAKKLIRIEKRGVKMVLTMATQSYACIRVARTLAGSTAGAIAAFAIFSIITIRALAITCRGGRSGA